MKLVEGVRLLTRKQITEGQGLDSKIYSDSEYWIDFDNGEFPVPVNNFSDIKDYIELSDEEFNKMIKEINAEQTGFYFYE